MNINFMNFIYNLEYMAKGMAGILIVIGAIILSVYLLGFMTSEEK